MPMIVREMILLDTLHFDSFRKPGECPDHSGWLGPPSSVPFAWEQAPGTPKQASLSSTPVPSSPTIELLCPSASEPQEPTPLELALVKVDSLRTESESSEPRDSIHILETAPPALLEAIGNEVPWNSLMSFRKGSVPFKWEMEPGIARDPDKCREFLNCPLTPPPVLHSRSVIIGSSRRPRSRQLSVSDRMRSFFHISSPGPRKKSSKSPSGAENSEDEDLSPVSVLDFSARRLSSASSATSYYHTPKGSFSWDSGQELHSSTRSSFKSPRRSSRELPSPVRKNGFASMFMQLQHKKKQQRDQQLNTNNVNGGCLMMLHGDNRLGSFNSYEVASSSSEKSSSATSSSLSSSSMASSERHRQQDEDSKHQLQNIESDDDDAQSAYYTPATSRLQSPAPFTKTEVGQNRLQLQLVERVDSLDTVDPGFAPSDSGDDDLVLCRMASFAHWQRREDSKKSSKRSQLAKNILGVIVCCYVPGEFR